jgi:hypothetical protein
MSVRLRDRPRLVGICAGAAVVETALVWAFARGSLGIATQVTAPPPFGVFHDLRWIMVYHESWLGFAGEVLAFAVFRSLLTACILREAWPGDLAPEPFAVTLRRATVFTLVAALLLAPWAGLMFAMAVVSLSWLFFVAVPVVLMLALLVHGGAVTGSWWRRTLPLRSLAWVLAAFCAITVFGSLLTTSPAWARLPLAVAAGTVNAAIWLRMVDAVLHPRRIPRRVAIAPLGIAAVLAIVIGGTALGFALSRGGVPRVVDWADAATTPAPDVSGAAGALLVVTGFNTQWNGVPGRFVQLDLPQQRFSYRGTRDGQPLPYVPNDTHRSLFQLARMLRDQVDAYHHDTNLPITLVAESEGALLAKTYLAGTPHAPVRNLVILSPLVEPGRVYYPSSGAEGWGAFGGLEISGLSWALHDVSPVDVQPDTPFLRSIVDHAPALTGLVSCALPGVRQMAVLPLDTAVSASTTNLGIPYTVVPAFHGGMLDDRMTAEVVGRVVAGRTTGQDAGWTLAEDVISAGASAWQVPALDRSVNDAWKRDPSPDDCGAVRAYLHRELAARASQG